MATFNILSVGDVEFLSNVINSVAMICGTGDFKQLCVCGGIMGLLYICFQCLFQGGQRINLQHTMVCIIVYMMFFGPSCTVTIESARNPGYVARVENVPMGVGVSGMAISRIGYGTAKLMEQAFSPIYRSTNWSYLEPLTILANLRTTAFTDEIFPILDAQNPGSDTRTALVNYLTDCTIKGIQDGSIRAIDLQNADMGGASLDDFKYNSGSYMTYLPLMESGALVGPGADGYMLCKDGWDKVKTLILTQLGGGAAAEQVNRLMHIQLMDDTGATSTPNDYGHIQAAIDAVGLVGKNAQDFVKAAVLEKSLYLADSAFAQTHQAEASAAALRQAMMQRDTQWASEQSMFVSTVNAIMAFFEGFVYAITPIMGFLVMLGGYGLSLLGKYCMVIAWIQLWYPCMSICNLYTLTGLRRALMQGDTTTSIANLSAQFDEVSHWIGVGGMMMASTPMLALFMISGSMYAFTQIAGRLNGRDHFNEKIVTPDAIQVGAVQTVAGQNTWNQFSGSIATGSENMLAEVSEGKVVGEHINQLTKKAEAATANLSSTLGSKASALTQFEKGRSLTRSIGTEFMSARSESGQTMSQFLQKSGVVNDQNRSQVNEALGQAALQLSGGAGVGFGAGVGSVLGAGSAIADAVNKTLQRFGLDFKIGVDGKATLTATNKDGVTLTESFRMDNSIQDSATKGDSLTTAASEAIKGAITRTTTETWKDMESATTDKSLQQAFSTQRAVQEELSNAQSFAQNFNSSFGKRNVAQLAQGLRDHNPAKFEELGRKGSAPQYKEEVDTYAKMLSGDVKRAQAAVALTHMIQENDTTGLMGTIRASRTGLTSGNEYKVPEGRVSHEDVDALKNEVNGQQNRISGEVTNVKGHVAQQGSTLGPDPDAEIMREATKAHYEKTNKDVVQRNEEEKGRIVEKEKEQALRALGVGLKLQPRALKIATTWLRNGPSFNKGGAVEYKPGNMPIEQPKRTKDEEDKLKDYLNKHFGDFSPAQKDIIRAYAFSNYHHNRPEAEKTIEKALTDLRNEARKGMFNGKNESELNEKEKRDLGDAVTGLFSELANIGDNPHAGMSTRILHFNRVNNIQSSQEGY